MFRTDRLNFPVAEELAYFMKPIFSRGPSLQLRLFLAILTAIVLIFADSKVGTFVQIRTYMDTAVSPFYFLSNAPREFLDNVSQTFASRQQLDLENRALRQELGFEATATLAILKAEGLRRAQSSR